MARKSKIVGFSLPPEVYDELEMLQKNKHKTRSEFIREMIDVYEKTAKAVGNPQEPKEIEGSLDLAKILKTYWTFRSQVTQKVIPIVLGIITNNKGQILIGARKDKDPWIKNLTWVFPGGSLKSLDFESELKREVKEETGIDIKVHSLIAARLHPNADMGKAQVIALYFQCELEGNDSSKPADGLSKLKWVKPTDVFKYFTTSVCDEVTKFLMTLEVK